MKKYIMCTIAAVLSATMVLPLFADNVISTKNAQLRPDFTITVDGSEKNFKSATGEAAYPILYQDSTYLPLRAIGELIGKNVNWDESTKTITISGTRTSTSTNTDNPDIGTKTIQIQERPDFTIKIDNATKTFYSATGEQIYPILYNGSTYLPLRAIGQIMNKEVTWNGSTKVVGLNGSSTVTDADSFGNQQTTNITVTKAKEIALNHAGLKENEVNFIRAELEHDDDGKVFDIEFYTNKGEYDYEINSKTGAIISFDYDVDNWTRPTTPTDTTTTITVEKAKEIALNHAGLTASSVSFIKAQLDYDDGIKVYEIEFYNSNKEYDYEINAATGAIISFDYDVENWTRPTTPTDTTTTITSEQAKQIAFNHAGVNASNVYGLKVELDYDDGQKKYEVEFKSGRMEYDYKINANTGTIIGYDSEYDD